MSGWVFRAIQCCCWLVVGSFVVGDRESWSQHSLTHKILPGPATCIQPPLPPPHPRACSEQHATMLSVSEASVCTRVLGPQTCGLFMQSVWRL